MYIFFINAFLFCFTLIKNSLRLSKFRVLHLYRFILDISPSWDGMPDDQEYSREDIGKNSSRESLIWEIFTPGIPYVR